MTSSQSPDLKREDYGRQTNGDAQCADPQAGRAWRDIASAPRDGSPILACSVNHDGCEVVCWRNAVHTTDEDAAGWVNNGSLKDRFYANPRWFTHWMPLPAPPSSAKPAERDSSRDELETLRAQLALAVGVLRHQRTLTARVMSALMDTRKRDDLLLADEVHRADAKSREALAALSPQEELEEVSSAESVTPLASQGGDTEAQSPAGKVFPPHDDKPHAKSGLSFCTRCGVAKTRGRATFCSSFGEAQSPAGGGE